MTGRQLLACTTLLLAILGTSKVDAHEMPFAGVFLDLTARDAPILSVELDLIDLAQLLPLDADLDRNITFGEYESGKRAIDAYIVEHLQLVVDEARCPLIARVNSSGIRPDVSPTVVSAFDLVCSLGPNTTAVQVNASLMTALDENYRTLLEVSGPDSEVSTLLSSGVNTVELRHGNGAARILAYVGEGIHHVLVGVDHLAFLLLLLLPVARDGSMRRRFLSIGGIVTAFTVAHSITLLLAASGQVSVQAYWVEILIAGSVVLAGILNVVRPAHRLSWTIAYAFGLVHGFGFASVLSKLVGADGIQVGNLLAFNVGVELGQLAVVAATLPLLSLLGNPARFQRFVVPAASACVALLGASWLWDRI